MRKIILLFSFLGLVSVSFSQSDFIEELEKNAKLGDKLYFYESYIRALNMDGNPDFYKLVQDVEYIKVIRSQYEGDKAIEDYRSLQKSILDEGFEEVMSFEDKVKGRASIYLFEKENQKSQWVAFVNKDGRTAALVMNGNLNLEYMKGISALNQEMLENYINETNFGGDWD